MVLLPESLVLHEIIDKLFNDQITLCIERNAHCCLYFYNAQFIIPISNNQKYFFLKI